MFEVVPQFVIFAKAGSSRVSLKNVDLKIAAALSRLKLDFFYQVTVLIYLYTSATFLVEPYVTSYIVTSTHSLHKSWRMSFYPSWRVNHLTVHNCGHRLAVV